MYQPDITIIVLVHNEEKNLIRLLDSLNRQILNPKEILLINNLSTDHSREIALSFIRNKSRFPSQWIDADENNLGKSRAMGISLSKTKLVAFIDADCEAPEDWLLKLYQSFLSYKKIYPSLAAIGGANIMPANYSSFYKSVAIMLQNFLGHCNATQAKIFKRDALVYHLSTCNVLYCREQVLAVGNFSEKFSDVCEDVELSTRIQKSGAQLLMLADNPVWHYTSGNIYKWVRRIFRFGRGQISVAKLHPLHLKGRLLLPIFFLLLFITAIITSFFYPFSLFIIFFYCVFIFLLSVFLAYKERALYLSMGVFLLFITTHFAYASGECIGLLLWKKK